MKMRWWCVLLIWTLLTACASAKGGREWASIPPVQTAEAPAFDVSLKPLKNDNRFFVAFQLDIKNKSDQALTLDWNQTRYLYDGRDNGVLVFRGIDPAALKEAAVPPDVIAPGATFSREVFPAQLVAFTPMREEVLDKKGKGLFPGPLPAGENGIRLVLKRDGKALVQQVTVEIR